MPRERLWRLLRTAGDSAPLLALPYRSLNERVRPRIHAPVQDAWIRARHGRDAPRFSERLWVPPTAVRWYDGRGNPFRTSARVVTGPWPPLGSRPLEEDEVLRAAILRWRDGVPWEQTGELERMERAIARKGPIKGCRTRADVLRRCQELDRIFGVVERERRLRPHGQVVPGTFRELGGIGMHVGPGGELVRAGNGRHRFAMAWVLGLDAVPVRVGLVHAHAIAVLDAYRRDPAGSV